MIKEKNKETNSKNGKNKIKLADKAFSLKGASFPKGAWLWWFWLFFIDDPKTTEKPRQLMILWSTKNEQQIKCNDKNIKLDVDQSDLKKKRDKKIDGAVAAWYFDGKQMHHNYLLESCDLEISNNQLKTDLENRTLYRIEDKKNIVEINDKFRFESEPVYNKGKTKPFHFEENIIGNKGFSMTRANRFNLKGRIDQEKIEGSAYFQRILVNAPAPSWYWGIFHFENGGILTYYNPYFSKFSIIENIRLFDGETWHRFSNLEINHVSDNYPLFEVKGENAREKIEFTVNSYTKSNWKFDKKVLNLVPNQLNYREYPAKIKKFKHKDKKTGKILTKEDMGSSIGNAEHTTGFLL